MSDDPSSKDSDPPSANDGIRQYRYLRFGDGLEEEIHTAHDRFLKRSLKERPLCLEMFRRELPETFQKLVNLEAYELVHTSHVHDSLHTHFTDALFKFPRRDRPEETAYSYMLFEGMRRPERFLAIRLLGYVLDIIEDHLRTTGSKTVPLVQTLVFYNGDQPFEGPLCLSDLIDGPDDLKKTMFDQFPVLNIKIEEDQRFLADLWYGFMALAMKHVDDEDTITFIEQYSSQIKQIKASQGQSWIHSVVAYLLTRAKKAYNRRDLMAAVQKLDPIISEDIMTIAESLRQEGKLEGLQEGKLEGLQEGRLEGLQKGQITTAKNLYSMGFKVDVIHSATGLSFELLKQVLPDESV